MSSTFTRAQAQALDAADPLASFRSRYLPQTPDVVAYLDGNSLGRPLASIAQGWSDFTHQQWAGRLIRGWSEGWMELAETVGDELAAAALGAAAGQTVIADSTTVNFYKALRAAINRRPGRRKVIIDRDNFPTNRYVVESLVKDLGLEAIWLTGTDSGGIGVADVAAVLDDDVAVLTMSHIAYRSGYLADARAITAAAHGAGALVVWDLCHSVGSVPIELDTWDVDFAVGCTYKFLGAGPGAPAFSYVNARHHAHLDQPIWGWLGRRDAFEMEQGYVPAPGIRSMISGTPSVLGILAVREGARVVADAGIHAIRAKVVALTEMVIALADEWLIPLGFGIGSPRDADRRGGHVSITRSDARELCAKLTDVGVLPDFRTPDAIRIGLSPLPITFTEVWDALSVLRDLAS
ncbi:kynureninase [Nakamurella sp. PAMC28650]|jgi:kynureninase|uniref:kynureninase n=1 Tax=Nakamurella sp. PAMC28650 TaxID=2762325 RepID=UPI00164D41AF|nr:kynureninase [Nakamurella sp. PAMC28650]QNK82430.1 kynureninase [Nakamurella sp. PAMC28650]